MAVTSPQAAQVVFDTFNVVSDTELQLDDLYGRAWCQKGAAVSSPDRAIRDLPLISLGRAVPASSLSMLGSSATAVQALDQGCSIVEPIVNVRSFGPAHRSR
jgi:hypothetical protein